MFFANMPHDMTQVTMVPRLKPSVMRQCPSFRLSYRTLTLHWKAENLRASLADAVACLVGNLASAWRGEHRMTMCRKTRSVQAASKRDWWTALWEEKGSEVLEFALIVPLLFTVLLGIFWCARAYNIYETITRAAREGVRFGVAPNCASCGNTLPTDSEIQQVISASLKASALDPKQTNPNPIAVARTPMGSDVDISVSFSYPYRFYLPFTSVNLTNVQIPTSVHMRQEQ